jgi:hypothetical protein
MFFGCLGVLLVNVMKAARERAPWPNVGRLGDLSCP